MLYNNQTVHDACFNLYFKKSSQGQQQIFNVNKLYLFENMLTCQQSNCFTSCMWRNYM